MIGKWVKRKEIVYGVDKETGEDMDKLSFACHKNAFGQVVEILEDNNQRQIPNIAVKLFCNCMVANSEVENQIVPWSHKNNFKECDIISSDEIDNFISTHKCIKQ